MPNRKSRQEDVDFAELEMGKRGGVKDTSMPGSPSSLALLTSSMYTNTTISETERREEIMSTNEGHLAQITKNVDLSVRGTVVSFAIKEEGAGSPFFVLGVRKSGSSMLNKIVNFLARRNGVNVVDVPGTFFRKGLGVEDWIEMDLRPLIRPQNVYSGFRNFPTNLENIPEFQAGLKIFMFRDPRDALISQYFSDAYSHQLPASGRGREVFLSKREEALNTDIDEWVLKHAGSMANTMLRFQPVLHDPKCLGLRYEDFVFQKGRLIHKILLHFDWTLQRGAKERLLSELDVIPESEDQTRFIRKAVPGDHRAKLKAETIRRLSNRLEKVLELYDYH
jgi:hypothetical protein